MYANNGGGNGGPEKNQVKLSLSPNGREVMMTTIIGGQPLAWIAFTEEQLGILIQMLRSYHTRLMDREEKHENP
jgi:hypothetical protein